MIQPDSSPPDPALLELFRAELDTHLPTLSDGLLSMEKGQADDGRTEAMMRAAHSIKGAARIVGIDPAVRLSHAMEDCFTAAKNQQIVLGSEAVDVLLTAVDTLQQICTPLATPAAPASPNVSSDTRDLGPLLDRLVAIRNGRPAMPPAPTPAAPASAAPTSAPPCPAEVRLQIPPTLDDRAAVSLRRSLLEALASAPPLIHLDFAQTQQVSALGMAIVIRFVREAAKLTPPPAVSLEHASADLAGLWRALGLESLLRGDGDGGAHAG